MTKNVFVCDCAACLRDGGPLFWRRAGARRASLTWVRTSAAARRGYGVDGAVSQIEYAWGACYDCVAPTPEAVRVPVVLFWAVELAALVALAVDAFRKKKTFTPLRKKKMSAL